ncbi:hypothetical protein KKF55_04130 [Patescibacteria group bacterium]|nr:hypothetical protein [Patescibacteria group bacterium]
MSETALQLSRGRTPGIQLSKNKQRNEFIVGMFVAGYTATTILKNVNRLAQDSDWGELATERSVKRIISEHFQGHPMSAAEAKAYDFGRREAALAQQQKLYEDLALHLRKREKAGDLSPYEFQYTKRIMANMLQKIIENNGWNASKKNCGKYNQGETQMEIFERNREELIQNEEGRQKVIDYIDSFLGDDE